MRAWPRPSGSSHEVRVQASVASHVDTALREPDLAGATASCGSNNVTYLNYIGPDQPSGLAALVGRCHRAAVCSHGATRAADLQRFELEMHVERASCDGRTVAASRGLSSGFGWPDVVQLRTASSAVRTRQLPRRLTGKRGQSPKPEVPLNRARGRCRLTLP